MHFTGVGVNQVSDDHGLEAAHIYFPVVAVFDVGKIGRVTTSMIWMTIGPARACISGALAFGHADPLHVKIGNIFRCALGLVSKRIVCLRTGGSFLINA